MRQTPKYVKTFDGRTARVILSLVDNYIDYYALIRSKTNAEKREVAHELIDYLGEDIYSNVLNEVIDFLESRYLREKKQVKRVNKDE